MTVRARDWGFPLLGEPGRFNAITDVEGVLVGYQTTIAGDGDLSVGQGPVRTGVTAILPRPENILTQPCAAGVHSFNGNGELTGAHWINERGAMSSPILITNTHAVGPCHRGVINWANSQPDRSIAPAWIFPVVGETYDGYLNDIDGDHVSAEQAVAALESGKSGPVLEGSVGGGTGMVCYGFKGGNGTSSRVVRYGETRYTVGAFVQANFGKRSELTVCGDPVGSRLVDYPNPIESDPNWRQPPGSGSLIVVIATDAPLLPGECEALARRATLGAGRTGTTGSHFSGDIFLAFSTANPGQLQSTPPLDPDADLVNENLEFVPWGRMNPLFEAAVQSVEEAILNALVVNEDMTGRDGRHIPAFPAGHVRGAAIQTPAV
ncbi:L-aminopeptidase/D-esterase [Streptacidiphilus jiangxiensis]|uniref:L-aminopeptidase/D-esterase n=2 Tax=Streptacidiphilus jiangxiensis TaxID=235985 RepID=A0A1H7XAB8_STRJI|nr:L-aminopeptidase/D-esterase [Streptacidiphilus jiangxiensis]